MRVIRSLIPVVVLIAAPCVLAARDSSESKPASKRSLAALKEYCQRAAKLPPRDAEAHFRLGVWCREKGLQQEAERCFREAIAVDSDHLAARLALGYSRYGTGWKRREEGEQDTTHRTPRTPPTPGVERDAESPQDADVAQEPSTEVKAVAVPEGAALEKKKAWAEAASQTFQSEFQTYEDRDFLIHTTHPSTRHSQVKALVSNLRQLKQDLSRFLGLRSRAGTFWPAKLQFVVLRYEEEYVRFAEVVDGIEVSPDQEAYSHEEHTVLWRPDSEILARRIVHSALDQLDGSDRWLAWWLREGIAELLFAQSPRGREEEYYRSCFAYAENRLRSEGEDLKIFFLLETPDYPKRDRARNRALALTLVDFLYKVKPKALPKLVKTLKSHEAPPVPAGDSNDEFKSYYLKYIAFQQKNLESLYRTDLLTLDARWKTFVDAQAERLKSEAQAGPR